MHYIYKENQNFEKRITIVLLLKCPISKIVANVIIYMSNVQEIIKFTKKNRNYFSNKFEFLQREKHNFEEIS